MRYLIVYFGLLAYLIFHTPAFGFFSEPDECDEDEKVIIQKLRKEFGAAVRELEGEMAVILQNVFLQDGQISEGEKQMLSDMHERFKKINRHFLPREIEKRVQSPIEVVAIVIAIVCGATAYLGVMLALGKGLVTKGGGWT